ncbi:MAG: hypothetical protein IJH65_04400 [Methanobrevibacter sp.]|nr:hypothetical protein [Methanobrevibacter sp.]
MTEFTDYKVFIECTCTSFTKPIGVQQAIETLLEDNNVQIKRMTVVENEKARTIMYGD